MSLKTSISICLFIATLASPIVTKINAVNKKEQPTTTLHVATYNIRLQTEADKEERAWKNRKNQVSKLISTYQFDIFGVQEIADKTQEKQLKRLLPAFDSYSAGRGDIEGKTGERLAIYYNKKRFDLSEKGFFFLAETPSEAVKGWDAAYKRVCIWAKFTDRNTNKTFYFFNLHLDHIGVLARAESAKLVTEKIKKMAGNAPVFCVGDFNAPPYETAVYNTMTATLADSRVSTETKPEGSIGTFNGWDTLSTEFPIDVLIDYIFTQNVKVMTYAVLNDKIKPASVPSDHFPVLIKCKIR